MVFTTNVTPTQIAVALGQPAPSTLVAQQWQTWIDDALMFIQDRADKQTVTIIPQAKIDYVVREVVVDQVKRRDQANDYDIEDASRFRTVADWWPLLGLDSRRGRAFEVDTAAHAGGGYPDEYWWSTPTTQSPNYIVQDGMIVNTGGSP